MLPFGDAFTVHPLCPEVFGVVACARGARGARMGIVQRPSCDGVGDAFRREPVVGEAGEVPVHLILKGQEDC